jgi:hypothetical protein
MDEVEVELPDDLRVLEDAEGHEGSRLEVAAALELKHVALGAHDGLASLQPLQKPVPGLSALHLLLLLVLCTGLAGAALLLLWCCSC